MAAARFVERPDRFLVRCRLESRAAGASSGEGRLVEAHLPDPGRLEELLVPGRRLRLRPEPGEGRKTSWTVVLSETPDASGWVSLDTTLPNRLVERALEEDWLDEVAGWRLGRREVSLGGSRLDFVLVPEDGRSGGEGRRPSGPEPTDRRLALEVKSVTLVRDGVGLFPDAVTERGARHVRELEELAGRPDWEAAVLFVVQRSDVEEVLAAESIDPEFSATLARARRRGVRALARRCRVGEERVRLGAAIPVS